LKKVVFIGGSSHSGSTMLDLMLSSHPECFSAGEVQSLFRPSRPHHINPICGCGIRGCAVWEDIYAKGKKKLFENIFHKYPDIDTIVDSSKSISWIYDQCRFLSGKDIKIYHIVIWKDPSEIAISLYKRNKINKFNKSWTDYYKNYFDIIKYPFVVKYKELAQNPTPTIQFLMKIIGKESIPNQHLYWQKKHHTLFGSAASRIHLHDVDSPEHIRLVEYMNTNERKNNVGKKVTPKNYRRIYYSLPNSANLPDSIQNKLNNNLSIQSLVNKLENFDYKLHNQDQSDCYVNHTTPPFPVIKEKLKYGVKHIFSIFSKK